MEKIEFQPENGKAQQIELAIILEIAAGKLATADKLMSVRKYAALLEINPNTVTKVYNSLKWQGYADSSQGASYTIAGGADVKAKTVIRGHLERRMRELRKESEFTGIDLT